MVQALEDTCVVTKIRVRPQNKNAFADWQAKLNSKIAAFPGFASFEILSPSDPNNGDWGFVQRFYKVEDAIAWRESRERKDLLNELQTLSIVDGANAIHDEKGSFIEKGVVTEVFVTQVSPENKKVYQDWISKMHQVEAKFPGFRGVYVQSPGEGHGRNWITFLQFDSAENLDRWLTSPERQEVMEEGKSLIESIESHRVISPYAGWFSSIYKEGAIPAVWKQTMIILLVLYPIVMLELRFLNPRLIGLNPALSTFIGNAISVSLVSWPLVPIAIWFLGWWLAPAPGPKRMQATILGTLVVLGLYLIEIALFWKLL